MAQEEMEWVDTTKEALRHKEEALQIVRINEDGTNFELDEKVLTDILSQVPSDMKVAIVSVVGAFRTGKSFILDLFLRYLRYCDLGGKEDKESTDWIFTGIHGTAQTKLEGNSNIESKTSSEGFSWRAGKERNTTGIWMWGQPFYRKYKNSNEKIAVFVVDTQGMFDSETSQMLTASIFGLSTLLSSYQIYNVDKRIQEDNLQHLALFTEYGRMALNGSTIEEDVEESLEKKESKDPKLGSAPEAPQGENDSSPPPPPASVSSLRPFQRLEFLVRDWQNFNDEEDHLQMLADMEEYLVEILSQRKQKDLADTREQINACFEEVSCWLLPHPGFEVTKKSYDGSVAKIRPEFLNLLSRYVHRVFYESIAPKKIHGRPVKASELLVFMKTYVNLFHEASIFPEAKTLLEATAEANNINQKDRSVQKYKEEMNVYAGINAQYIAEAELKEHHDVCKQASLKLFDEGANMGRRSQIISFRKILIESIDREYEQFKTLNAERDPYKNFALYVAPASLALGLMLFRVVQDMFCYEEFGYDIPVYDCKHVSLTVAHAYWALIIFMLLMTIATGQAMFERSMAFIKAVKTIYQQTQTQNQPKEKKE